jgi:hypothetical protein
VVNIEHVFGLENRIMTSNTVLIVDYFMALISDCSHNTNLYFEDLKVCNDTAGTEQKSKENHEFLLSLEMASPSTSSVIMVASHPVKQAWFYCHWKWLPPSANSVIMVASHPIKQAWLYCHWKWLPPSADSVVMVASHPIRQA